MLYPSSETLYMTIASSVLNYIYKFWFEIPPLFNYKNINFFNLPLVMYSSAPIQLTKVFTNPPTVDCDSSI